MVVLDQEKNKKFPDLPRVSSALCLNIVHFSKSQVYFPFQVSNLLVERKQWSYLFCFEGCLSTLYLFYFNLPFDPGDSKHIAFILAFPACSSRVLNGSQTWLIKDKKGRVRVKVLQVLSTGVA